MNFRDVLKMAMGNLWSRKMRTGLNLLGVVISAVLLTMTFAGTRGASDGVMNIINSSDKTRQFMIFASPNQNTKVPESAIAVDENVKADRRLRLQEALRQKWIRANAKRLMLDGPMLQQLRAIDDLKSLVPQGALNCQFSAAVQQEDTADQKSADNQSADQKSVKARIKNTAGSLIGTRLSTDEFRKRLIVGDIPAESDANGVLLDEFTAWKMGFHDDEQLKALIGQRFRMRFQLGRHALSGLVQTLGSTASDFDPVEMIQFASSIKSLMRQLDATELDESEKALIRQGLRRVAGVDIEKANVNTADLPEDVEVDRKGNRQLVRELVVRGVVRRPDADDDTVAFLQITGRPRLASVYSHHALTEAIHFRRDGFKGFVTAFGEVDHVNDLAKVTGEIEAIGLRTRSALSIIERLQVEVNKLRLAIGAIALLILLVAAIGISNTMIIAVLERTPEFGIMKSLGATDRQVLTLVLCEGLLTGVLGALIALAISLGLAEVISDLCRSYIESRLKGTFDQAIFRFTFLDVAIVFLVTALVCIFASLMPAWRAARLDPVAAMRR